MALGVISPPICCNFHIWYASRHDEIFESLNFSQLSFLTVKVHQQNVSRDLSRRRLDRIIKGIAKKSLYMGKEKGINLVTLESFLLLATGIKNLKWDNTKE